jgi:riboflavin biosynthesis protein RibD
MAAALDMARRGIGFTSPNPPVGAVIVRDEQIIGQGYHRKAGEPHAEVEALRDAMQRNPKAIAGATLYVTLEPCCTTGRTPPCTEAIRAARIGRVVYGCQDPNPAHAGRADAVLHEARIALTAGVEEQACKEIIRPFAKWINTGLPYVRVWMDASLGLPASHSGSRVMRLELIAAGFVSEWMPSSSALRHCAGTILASLYEMPMWAKASCSPIEWS